MAAAEMALDHVNKSAILRDYELRMIVKDSKVRVDLSCAREARLSNQMRMVCVILVPILCEVMTETNRQNV